MSIKKEEKIMPRDLPVGNGSLLLNFDKSYNLRDIYWPHVGQELQTAGDISHTGVWVEGQFAWLDAPEWQRDMVYEPKRWSRMSPYSTPHYNCNSSSAIASI